MPEMVLYDTAANISSILRARHLEFLSEGIKEEGGKGLILQLACLLKKKGVDTLGKREYKSMFVMAFCEVLAPEDWPRRVKKKMLKNYHHELFYLTFSSH